MVLYCVVTYFYYFFLIEICYTYQHILDGQCKVIIANKSGYLGVEVKQALNDLLHFLKFLYVLLFFCESQSFRAKITHASVN